MASHFPPDRPNPNLRLVRGSEMTPWNDPAAYKPDTLTPLEREQLNHAGYQMTLAEQLREAFDDRLFCAGMGFVAGCLTTVTLAFCWAAFS